MKSFSKANTFGTWLIVACMAIGLSDWIYVLRFEKPYLTYPSLPFPVQKTVLRPGDTIPVVITRCNSEPVPHSYNVSRALLEINTGALIPMEQLYSRLLTGCKTANPSLVHRVPIGTPAGRYKFFGGAVVHGTVRTFDVDFESEPFDVVTP